MVAQVWGVVVSGIAGLPVKVEVEVSPGLPTVGVVGLPDASVGEARWRVRSAIVNSGCSWPGSRITVGLSPADVPKNGTSLDLPITVGILLASKQIPLMAVEGAAFIGEVGLDGAVRPFPAVLPAAIAAVRIGLTRIFVESSGARQVCMVPGIEVIVVRDVGHVVAVLRGQAEPEPLPAADRVAVRSSAVDMADVRGHEYGRFAIEVAAAGGHHLSLLGPPGVGKTLLAERIPTILPDLGEQLSIDVTSIHAVAGQVPAGSGLIRRPPFQAPHHSASSTALLGTIRRGHPVPGAATLAHGGVLFLDEAPEFDRPSLEGLRQPMESGEIRIMRAAASAHLPARFQLVLAANPCPCGLAIGKGLDCRCTSLARRRYAERISGPLRDRIDIRIDINRPSIAELNSAATESSRSIGVRVAQARSCAARRFEGMPWSLNSLIPAGELRRQWRPDARGCELLDAAEQGGLSLRGVDRVLRIAWTLADLADRIVPGREQVATALGLRGDDGMAAA